MKKMIALALILMVGAVILVGCTSAPSDNNNLQPPAFPDEVGQDAPSDSGTNDVMVPPALPED